MISFDQAYTHVLEHTLELGVEVVPLMQSLQRVLAEDICADRDFPPFDRATKDGIAINYSDHINTDHIFQIEGVAAAGAPQQELRTVGNCVEVMTGAVVPKNTDTVIMYEHISITDNVAVINEKVTKGQNIHYKGSDEKAGAVLLTKGIKITAAEIGVMATVGKSYVTVKANPKITTIATGNELVEVDAVPLPHQIRKSNTITLEAALQTRAIPTNTLHLIDNKEALSKSLQTALEQNDVLLLSGGVSKGKFDFIPEVMESLGVEKVFHRVAQRPGKPFWFGVHKELKTVIFSFPGNPVSTFANFHVYFLPWLHKCWNIPVANQYIKLSGEIHIKPPLTRFIQVCTKREKGGIYAVPISENGSGDLLSLSKSNGFICLQPREKGYRSGELVAFISTK
ncbi:molybdopterin molybdochelatase [Maribacter sedimenticola]|uniref:Molybdopterin molybdenumtransferase n=1 Tax=Maribacter sedimenticola TaxID=228956 RepID=A0ABY1SK50_9FLAO|nr:molybdopterin molybdotransferase MoeA [Maribacter sedimenticola]SNR68168.1 molybdopterin molybdochelatase [Maribacter sedimenticola]